MDNIRRAIATFSIVAILSSFVVSTAFAGTFTDVKEGTYYYDAVEAMVEAGIIPGTAETYNPGGNLTRALAAKYVVEGAGWEVTTHDTVIFQDVPKTHSEFDIIGTAYDHGFMNGSGTKPGYFLPEDTVNRAEFARMAVKAFELEEYIPSTPTFTDVPKTAWFYKDVETAKHYEVITGMTATIFAPSKPIVRQDGAVMTVRAIEAEAPAEGEGEGEEGEGEGEAVEGDLDVAVSDDTPETATLPSGATSVQMASWDFTAGEADATIDSLVITRYGVSTLPTSHSVYLYEGSTRLTSGKSVNSSTNLVTFTNLNYEVPAGETKTLTLRMDVGTVSATGEIGFELIDAEDIDAGDGTVSGDFPLQGEKFGLSTTPAGTVTIEKNGTVTNPKVGQQDVTVAKFKISAATEDASLQELGVYFGGTITTTDIGDLKLYVSGTTDPIAEVDALNAKDIAQFMIDPGYDIVKGDTRNFSVTASFNTGRSNDTVHAYIDESTDVLAIGSKYGYGMGVTMTLYDGNADSCASASSNDCTYSALEGGDVTISGTSIANRNLAVNQDDVSVLKFTIAVATDVTFDNFVLALDTGTTAEGVSADAGLWKDSDNSSNFTDIKIKEVGGDAIWGPIDSDELDSDLVGTNIDDTTEGDGTEAYYIFTDDLVMEAGESKDFEVTFDVANNANLSNETIAAKVYIDTTYPILKDVNNKTLTNSTSLVPTSTYTGDTFTVKTNSLTVAKSSSVGSTTKVIGTEDVQLLALSVGAGDASSTKITSITVTGYIDDNGTTNAFVEAVDTVYFNEVVLGMDLYKGSVSEANKINTSAKSANTLGKVTFDNLSWTIPAGQTETLIITGNLANNATYDTDQFKVDIEDVSADIIAEDDKGNAVSSTSSDGPNGEETDSATLYAQTTVSSGGAIAIDIPSNTPSTQVVVGGTTGNELAKVKLTASRESFTVNKVAIQDVGSAYDDNISALKVKYYTNAAQTTEATTTCAAAATAGVFNCSGMSMYVPDTDLSATPDYAIMTVIADMNDVANSQADEGDLPGFSVYFAGDFEATGVGSSTKILEENLTLTDLTTFTNIATALDVLVDGAVATATATSITVDLQATPGSDITAGEIVAGDVLCITVDDASDCSTDTDELVFVTAVTDNGAADSTLTVVRGYAGSTAAAIADGEYVYLVKSGADRAATTSTEVETANANMLVNGAVSTTTGTTLTVDTASAATTLAKGDVICVTAAANAACSADDEQLYVDAVASATSVTVKRGWNSTTAATIANDEEIYLVRKANNLLMTNFMELRATDLDLTTTSSRTGSTNATEAIMTLTATANAAKDVNIRQGYTTTSASGAEGTDTGGVSGTAEVTTAGLQVDGSATTVTWTGAGSANATVVWAGTGFNNYARVGFWLYFHDNTGADALDASDLQIFTGTGVTVASGQGTALTISDPAEDTWTFVDMAIPAGTDASDVYFGIDMDGTALAASSATAAGDYLAIDQVTLYNEKLNVDLTLNENWAAVTPTLAYLKQNGTVVATGYLDIDAVVTSKTGQVTFVPLSTYADIEIGGTDTLTVEIDTATAITDDSSATEKLTAKVDLGAYGTAGDVYWYDGAGTTSYLGVSATDSISTVTSY